MRLTARPRRDNGLTLTELLVTIVVLGLIMGPLAGAVIGLIRLTDDTSRRLGETHDVQIAAAYFASDVQSMGVHDWTSYPYPLRQSIELNPAADGGLYPCGSAGDAAPLVRLAWDDPQVDGSTGASTQRIVRVAYQVRTVGAETQLRRILCRGDAAPASDIVLVHNLDATNLQAPVCSTSCTGSTPPATVTLTLPVKHPRNSTGFTVALTGVRRQT